MLAATRRQLLYASMMACDAWLAARAPRGAAAGSGAAIVRLDAVGDFLLWLEAGRETARRLGAAEVTLIANAAWADYARQLGWRRVLPLDVRALLTDVSYRLRSLRRIAAENFAV